MKITDRLKPLDAVLSALAPADPPAFPVVEDPAEHVVHAFLLWDAPAAKAVSACERLRGAVVDLNDLRVSTVDEIVDALPAKYPQARERADRLRAVLRGIYLREHGVTLGGLASGSKRDVVQYLDGLPGMVPFVAARVALVGFGVEAVPVDGRILQRLRDEAPDAVDEKIGEAETAALLAKWASGAGRTASDLHARLLAWVESAPSRRATTRSPGAAKDAPAKDAPAKKARTKTAPSAGKKSAAKKATGAAARRKA